MPNVSGQGNASAPLALRRELSVRDLVLFNISAVVGIRWVAAAAHVGPGSLALWALAAVLFFVPSALAVSSLSRLYPGQGGLYVWAQRSFGDWHGFLCGWLYWCSNLFYFPNLLVSGVAMAVYSLRSGDPRLSGSPGFVLGASLVVLWIAMLTNLVGLRIGKWTENVGGASTYIAVLGLVVTAMIVWMQKGAANHLDLVPAWSWEKLNFWSQLAFAFVGLELGAVMGGEIRDPERTVPRAAWISGLAIAVIYILGTLALLVLLPSGEINIVTGLAQAAVASGRQSGLPWLSPLIATLIMAAVAGQLGAWIAGSSRIPFVMGVDRYLPAAFAHLHPRWRTPHVAILTQGTACTVFVLAMQAGDDLRTAYQLLVDMTVITTFVPFLYIFLASYKNGQRLSGAAGMIVTACGIAFALVPPSGSRSAWLFAGKLLAGCALLIAAGRIIFVRGCRAKPARK